MVNNIIYYLKHSAKRFPDKVAFRDYEKQITFSELDRSARLLASNINRKLNGLVKQPIGIYLPKSVDAVIAFMATLYSGNFYTPLDPTMPKLRFKKLLSVLNPAMIITNNENKNDLLPELILIDNVEPDDMNDNLLDSIANEVIDTDILYVMFTSGSTGDPKGVIVSHRAVIDYINWLSDVFEFNESTIFGNQAPFSFDNSVLDLYSTIKNGCETVIIPNEMFLSTKRLCTFINENKINTIFWVPSAMILVANARVLEKFSMNQLTKILFAGEVMPTKQLNVWRRFMPNALYANLYGPTEIAVDCTFYIVDREFDDEESLPIGTACKNTGILVLNEKDELVSEGEIGELCVRGSCLAHGYYGNPLKTKEVFVQNPLNHKYPEKIYRTGDLVKYNNRKEIIYVGRKDTQIKHRGYRIELGEIETAASSALEIDQCCAVYDNDNKQIVIFVTPENINKNVLFAHLKNMLPNYMLPGLIVSKAIMPLNQNGKIDRLALTNSLKEGIMKKLIMDRVSCHLTAKCNLRCKKCAVYIPKLYEIGNVPEYDINDIKNSFRTYFSLVEQVRLISLTGGEPLLYPHLAGLIEYLLEHEQSFLKLEVFTNGATAITETVLRAMSKSEKVSLFIDNYGPEVSKKVDEVEQKCKKFNVKYSIRNYSGEDVHLGGWVDRRILSKKLDDETAKAHFSKCVVAKPGGRLFAIFGRYLAFCATPYCGYRIGELPEKDVLRIDLCDENVTLEEMHNKLFKMDKVDFNPGCAWCNGLGIYKNVERFTPGEQVEIDE